MNYKRVFISYQWDIKEDVKQLRNILKSNGFEAWLDDDKIHGGDNLNNELADAILNANIFISCITKNYANSEMCNKELTFAFKAKKKIIPILFEDLNMVELRGVGLIISNLLYIKVDFNKKWENVWLGPIADKLIGSLNNALVSKEKTIITPEIEPQV